MIGKSVPRVDAYEKVTGRAKFTDDLVPPRCLVAKVLHATIGNGIVKSIDTSEAVALEGVVKVVTFYDVPDHCYPTPGHPWSVELAHQDVADRNLLTGRVRYYGDDIAAVVAEDEIIAARALKLIKVEYEEYPVEIHPRKSMYGSNPPIHFDKKDNVLARSNYFIGDVDKNLLPDVHSNYEINICGSSSYYLHECMELLPVAEGNHDRQQSNDNANVDRKPDHRLCNRLWYADVRRIILFHPDNGCILRTAETVRRRYYRSG